MSTYLVFFEVIHDRYDSGQEYIVSSSKKRAIKKFRDHYPKDRYKIKAIYKQLRL